MITRKTIKYKIKRIFPFLNPFYRIVTYGVKIMQWKPTYDEDDLITNHLCDFLSDPRFVNALKSAQENGHLKFMSGRWRLYTACWVADVARHLDGDFVECGVAYGQTSRIIMEYIGLRDLPKRLYLVDTYEGLVDKYLSPGERKAMMEQTYLGGSPYSSATYDVVKKGFAAFPNVSIVRGAVPDVLESVKPEKVAYLHLDMNSTIPEIAAARYFWPKMVHGAMMLLDDYGFAREQHDAFDKFAAEEDVSVLSLPTGQGLIVKP